MGLHEEVTRLQIAKEGMKAAIESKGMTIPEGTTVTYYPEYIDQIQTAGKYQDKSVVPTTEQQVVEADTGYDALRRVLVEKTPLQEETVIPNPNGTEVLPTGDNIGMSKVTVSGDNNLVASNIKDGTTIFGVTGNFKGGTGDNYNSLGSKVTVKAMNKFNKGDIFIGTKNDEAVPVMQSEQLYAGMQAEGISKDKSVMAFEQYDSYGGYRIGIKNSEGTYTIVTLPYPENFNTTPYYVTQGENFISDDGSYIINTCYGKGLLSVKINKSALTGTINFMPKEDMGGNIEITSGNNVYTDGYVNSYSGGIMIENKLLLPVSVKYNEGKSTITKAISYKYSSSTNSFSRSGIEDILPYGLGRQFFADLGDGTAIHCAKPRNKLC